ncbi:MAG: hypothetical protein CBE06_000255 [Pelagibacteraceae bacterium TMED246]|nr:MAG: hypothetical protein CBE06_000255 [Pelagibacteraceae bacterium TMED246]
MKTFSFHLAYIILVLIFYSCNHENPVTVYKVKKTDSLIAKQNNKENRSGLDWIVPNNWIEKKATDFRLASYDIRSSNGELIDLSITVFPGDAGGVEQNVNRWRRQINLSPLELNQLMNESSTQSSMLGEFYIFDLYNKNNNQAMIATIMPYYENSNSILETIFVKMVGSIDTLSELKYEFELFCKSIHRIN